MYVGQAGKTAGEPLRPRTQHVDIPGIVGLFRQTLSVASNDLEMCILGHSKLLDQR
jgi:hypothetical protein